MTGRNDIYCIAAVILLVVLGCGKTEEEKQRDKLRQERPGKFNAARPDFARKPSRTVLVNDPFIKGKVVTLESTDGAEPHYAYFPPPEFTALEAMTPEEVGTVVLKECRSTQKGVYRTTENPPREVPAIAIDCDVSLIDRQAGTVYFVRRFEGKLNEQASISDTSNSVSKGPSDEINKFLGSLPKR